MQSVISANVQNFLPTAPQNASTIVQKDARLSSKTSLASRRIISTRNNGLTDSESSAGVLRAKKGDIYATEPKHEMHRSSKRGVETQTIHRGGKKFEERTSNKIKPWLRREGTNIGVTGKDISETKNNRGRWGKFGDSPQGKAKTLNASKEESKFGSSGDFFSLRTFKDLGASEDMLEALKTQGILRPSNIQALAYKRVLDGQSCIIAEQSGSGKTLAYLAPLIQHLREEELEGKSKSFSKSPRALILVPTAELATQVLTACRAISRAGMPFKSMVATGGFKWKTQRENLEQGTDILIATPGRFCFLMQEGELQTSNLLSMVLDEVDILFDDEDFALALEKLTSSAPLAAQYLFVTATLPLDVHNKLVERFPDCKAILGPGLHRTCSGLEEVAVADGWKIDFQSLMVISSEHLVGNLECFGRPIISIAALGDGHLTLEISTSALNMILIDCSGEGEEKNPETALSNKKTALLRIVEQFSVRKTIVFCNKIETCRKVENILKRIDRQGQKICILPFHAAVSQESRASNMKHFLDPQSEQSLFLICTDRASRGLDLINVDHVLLFDFPRDPSEYVRRVGRTARGAGGRGKAFVFVVGKQVSLAQKIIYKNEKGQPLHDLPPAL